MIHHLRQPHHVVLEVRRHGASVIEEHVCFSTREATRLAARNWPLAHEIHVALVEPFKPKRKDIPWHAS